ncbi:MAG: hypothetical protein PT977_15900 [Acidobacteriota bacterium]|nr:hypothetical protein [Acidobacteriota bacterium]
MIVLARAFYRNGNLAEAVAVTDEIEAKAPGCAAVLLNRAFFAALRMNHREMIERYDELRRLPISATDINLLDVHDFLLEEARCAPENLGLVFASGMVRRLYDERGARHDFETFLKKSARGYRWGLLRTRADRELGALRGKRCG